MTEQAPESGQGSFEGTQGQQFVSAEPGQQGTGGINPAWNEMLNVVPQNLHSQVLPHLQKWDQGVQQRFQQVHSQYEPYKPFIENNITPDDIQFAMGLVNAINNDPLQVREALNAWIEQEGIQNEQAQQAAPGTYYEQGQETPDFTQHPEYQRMQEMVESMAGILLQQREAEEQSQADQELDDEISQLHEQHGEFDENFVLAQMMNGMDGAQAIQAWQQLQNQILSQQRRPGPKLLGAGGALPSREMNVRELNSKQTRSLVEDMLRSAAQQE